MNTTTPTTCTACGYPPRFADDDTAPDGLCLECRLDQDDARTNKCTAVGCVNAHDDEDDGLCDFCGGVASRVEEFGGEAYHSCDECADERDNEDTPTRWLIAVSAYIEGTTDASRTEYNTADLDEAEIAGTREEALAQAEELRDYWQAEEDQARAEQEAQGAAVARWVIEATVTEA